MSEAIKPARKRAAKKPEEKRIYILVPSQVQTGKNKSLYMEDGRLMAQCAHVARKMQDSLTRSAWIEAGKDKDMLQENTYEELTTIVLGVRNNQELRLMANLLSEEVQVFEFQDTNPTFYKTKGRFLTAVCTEPVEASRLQHLLGHLPLYD